MQRGKKIPFTTNTTGHTFEESYASTIELDAAAIPVEFSVSKAYPNPFNPSITTQISLPHAGDVRNRCV